MRRYRRIQPRIPMRLYIDASVLTVHTSTRPTSMRPYRRVGTSTHLYGRVCTSTRPNLDASVPARLFITRPTSTQPYPRVRTLTRWYIDAAIPKRPYIDAVSPRRVGPDVSVHQRGRTSTQPHLNASVPTHWYVDASVPQRGCTLEPEVVDGSSPPACAPRWDPGA